MTKLATIVFGIFIVLASSTIADAHRNDGLEGFVIGGVGGAVIGHAISGSPEGLIVGSVLGSTLGMLIDASNDLNRVVVINDHHRHHRNWSGHYYRGRWPHRGDRYYGKYRHNNRWGRHRERHHR